MKRSGFEKILKHRTLVVAVLYFIITLLSYKSFLSIAGVSPDYLQGISSKILYLHVPSAWLALGIYLALAISSFLYIVFKNPNYDLISESVAGIGATFTLITLVTGAIWGKQTWGAWWVWDARLTSMLVLLFIYISYISIRKAFAHSQERGAKASAALAIIGLINIPIIKLSVYLWSSLHQKSTFFKAGGPSMHDSMIEPIFYTTPLLIAFSALIFVLRLDLLIIKAKIARLKIKLRAK